MIAKPARKVWYEIGNRNGQVFVVGDPDKVYYQQAYYNNYGNVVYQNNGEIDTWLLPDVKFIPHWKFDMPPIQWVQEKPVCMQDHIEKTVLDTMSVLGLGVSKYEETAPKPDHLGERPGGGRKSPNPSINPFPVIIALLVGFIDWLNNLVGADNPKRKDKNDQHPSWLDVYTEHQNEKPSWHFRPVLRLIDWLDGNAAPKREQTEEERIANDPLGFVGEDIHTLFGMSAGDFRYGSNFQVVSFNKRKQTYTVYCQPMGKTEIRLAVQTLIAFEAEIVGKSKNSSEQMATLGELFDGYEDCELPEPSELSTVNGKRRKPPEPHPRFRPSEETVRR